MSAWHPRRRRVRPAAPSRAWTDFLPHADASVFCSGATGYIGGAISHGLARSGLAVMGGLRTSGTLPDGVTPFVTHDLAEPGLTLPPVSTVIHAAGLGHRRGVGAATWRRHNVDAAVNLARAARAAGAARFILISTSHIHGREHNGAVTDTTPPNPMDVYAESKLQAEHDVAAAFGAGLVIIRPAAVIGPGCPGNIAFLIKLLKRGVPLPLGLIENRRSFIAREDLCAITLLAVRAENPPESILAAHPETIGTPDLVRALAEGLDVKPKLLNWPPRLLGLGSAMLGRAAKWQSISGNFVANPAAARALGWQPAETLAETLRRTARYHVTTQPKA